MDNSSNHPNKKQKLDNQNHNKNNDFLNNNEKNAMEVESAKSIKQDSNIVNNEQSSNSNSLSILISNNNYYSEFKSLFLYDWFLIEIGKHLIGMNDHDLINILCLNKKINERATIVFRQHFLNFELQKQVKKLINQDKFNQIQDIFQKNALSLNPNNLNFDLDESIQEQQPNKQRPSCIHLRLQRQNIQRYPQADPQKFECQGSCALWTGLLHLIIAASRFDLDLLVRSILFHPRFDFNLLIIGDVNEVFHWSIVKGHLDILKFIISKCRNVSVPFDPLSLAFLPPVEFRKCRKCTLSVLDFSVALFKALDFSRFDVLEELWKIPTSGMLPNRSDNFGQMSEISLDLAFEKGGSELLERLLNSNVFNGNSFFSIYPNSICKSNDDYFYTLLKFALRDSSLRHVVLPNLPNSKIQDGMKFFLERFEDGNGKNALSFAFFMCMNNELNQILKMKKFNDEELLALLRDPIPIHIGIETSRAFEILKLILNELSEQTQFSDSDVEHLTECFATKFRCLKLIWYDKRVVHNSLRTFKILMREIRREDSDFMELLLSQLSMSEIMPFKFGQSEIHTEVRNCCWLSFLSRRYRGPIRDAPHLETRHLEEFLKKFGLKWNQELFDMSLQFINESPIGLHHKVLKCFLDLPHDESWWNENKIHSLFLVSCNRFRLNDSFSVVLKKFPKANLSFHNNAILRAFLKVNPITNRLKLAILSILDSMISRIQFEDKAEQQTFLKLAQNSDILEKLRQFKIRN